ncbi:MAG: hypothetical protein NUV53_02705 [Patescibacteria group bacterium]|nr:hypothetical protein [Patescibacteria group bacterium]
MKTMFLIIILLAIIGIALFYFLPPSNFETLGLFSEHLTSPGVSSKSLSSSVGNISSQLSKSVIEPAQEQADGIVQQAKDVIASGTTSIGSNITQSVSNVLSGITQAAKDTVANTLGITANQISLESPETASANLSICTTLPHGTAVTYAIQNPFSPPQDFSFSITWGDGATSHGDMNTQDEQTVATHRYDKSGKYLNVFSIIASTQTITLKRKVCIE